MSSNTTNSAAIHGYRADIDGLRALAILSVLVFHAFPKALPGGFIGVDIFFVISGYLISGILIDRLDQRRFSIWQFYKQRAKRIFPALAIVMLATFVVGWRILLPNEFKQLGSHMLAGTVFVQNFMLLNEVGYFDVASELKPLMHLWSLAIEEQFYLLYPPALWLLWRVGVSRQWSLLILAAASMAANLAMIGHDASAAFFLPQTRFWELLAGGILASATQGSQKIGWVIDGFRRWATAGSALGMALIATGLALITPETAFPGWYALLPVLGAVLLIACGQHARLSQIVFANRFAVFIGLISYPLYLWHWPILSYLNILQGGPVLAEDRLIAMAASVLLAWLTYRLIERPVRFSSDGWAKVPAIVCSLAVVGYLGFNTYQREGLPFRVAKIAGIPKNDLIERIDFAKAGCGLPSTEALFDMCLHDQRGQPRFALIGDSKAKALAPGVLNASTSDQPWVVIGGTNSKGSLVPVISGAPLYRNYQLHTQRALDAIDALPSVEVVVVTVSTRALYQLKNEYQIDDLATNPNGEVAYEGLAAAIDRLVGKGKKVVLTVDNPTLRDPKRCLFFRDTGIASLNNHFRRGDDPYAKLCAVTYTGQRKLAAAYLEMIHKVQARHPAQVRLFDPTALLCDVGSNSCGMFKDGQLMYSYSDHISDVASQSIAKELVPFVNEFARERPPRAPL